MRIGQGYDAHRFSANRDLILGGVVIPHEKGLLGHSDADVLTHAICDALLGAAGLGDLGTHFPDSDTRYQGISSLKLLAEVASKLGKADYAIVNIDATVVAEEPKLKEFIPAMEKNIAAAAGVHDREVSIKATTTEGMGFTGRREGIVALAATLIQGGCDHA
ncbi:MAG: 2-C-methyl-D-erythritol 2,4-cyclodiphosphate synthase [bacterium]|nr:2-C-methyl-D-erythritol 2,4-cyclodiphosphate synthase [bacterium]